mmetsp:Transcript_22494/g.64691  ORF Transcript_22494/g.64691 Transcript_22494/m.64691 type:complete len:561 (-) Transcript_22494:32-1714(-)
MLPEPIEGCGMSVLTRGLAFVPPFIRNRHHSRGLLAPFVSTPTRSSAAACGAFAVDATGGDDASDVDEEVIDETTLQALIRGDDGTDSETDIDGDADFPGGNGQPPAGLIDGFYVVKQYQTPQTFDLSSPALSAIDGKRVSLSPTNVTLPIALMLIDSDEYPSLSRARKAIRQKSIVVHRTDANTNVQGEQQSFPLNSLARPQSSIGKASDRIIPGDVVAKQIRLSHGDYSRYIGFSKPPFDLPVLYEDDHIAVVNKPAGVAVYDGRENSQGRNTIRYALPHVLQPPSSTNNSDDNINGENEIESGSSPQPQPLARPISCHRLDMPTSGVLVCAKTLESVIDMSRQFEHRIVRKTYAAIVNGKLEEEEHGDSLSDGVTTISSREAYEMGVDVDPNDSTTRWQVAHDMQEGKEALTVWRVLKHCPSTKAKDGMLTLVELKPKTGRKHQLRRHLAWNYGTPIVGDTTYGELHDAKRFGRGLMLTSCHVAFEHPYYSNSEGGRLVWEKISSLDEDGVRRLGNNVSQTTEDSPVIVDVSMDFPNKFNSLLLTEEKRASAEGIIY